MRFINDQSAPILEHICNKYPQTDVRGVNKRLKEYLSELKINNWSDDKYDLVRKSQIYFQNKSNSSLDHSK